MALKPSFAAILILLLVKPILAQESPPKSPQLESPRSVASARVNESEAKAEPQTLPPRKAAVQLSEESAWLVVGSALIGGAFLAASGLSAECAGGTRCRRLASLSFWGGIGIASGGTVLGLTVIQQGRDSAVSNQVGLTVEGDF